MDMDGFTRRGDQQPRRPQQPNMAPEPLQRPQPQYPQQIPVGNSQPANPVRRPAQGFSPPNPTPAPAQDFRRPYNTPNQPLQPRPAQPQPGQGLNTESLPRAAAEEPSKKRRFVHKPSKISVVLGVIMLGIIGTLILTSPQKSGVQKTVAKSNPTVKPLETPSFTTYYPNPMPFGLTTSKGSITYYKDSFAFIIEQDGQKRFFVFEQPGSTDPTLSSLKSKTVAPQAFTLYGGTGIQGGFETGTLTAVKTVKDTILIITCTSANCGNASKQILTNMQIAGNLADLRKSN